MGRWSAGKDPIRSNSLGLRVIEMIKRLGERSITVKASSAISEPKPGIELNVDVAALLGWFERRQTSSEPLRG
jgi:hypothetical protein